MPTRRNTFLKNHYYHIYNRGTGKQQIFLSNENYRYCLELVEKYSRKVHITVIAFCLMPNHYHFLLRQEGETPVSEFIKMVFNAYVQAFNRWHERSGTLFEGRFKHRTVDKDSYLLQLCRYIHLNPVTARLVAKPQEWEFSDYREWICQRSSRQVDREFIRQYFSQPSEYESFVMKYWDEKKKDDQIMKYLFD